MQTESKELLAQRHRVELHKTKVGGKDTKIPVAHFHTKTGGRGVGFDRARDLLEVAEEHGVIESGGARYSFGGERFAHGKEKAIDALEQQPQLFQRIEQQLEQELRPPAAVPAPEPTAPSSASAAPAPHAVDPTQETPTLPSQDVVAASSKATAAPRRPGMKGARKTPKRKAAAKKGKGSKR